MAMTASVTTKTLFLPGAGASALFWKPVADRLGRKGVLLSWPGLGNEPPRSDVRGIDDLVSMVLDHIDEPINIVAQSMGGLVAIKTALAVPDKVKRLVLTATSGGIPVASHGGSDWRQEYFAAYPSAARWIADNTENLSGQIPSIKAPTLLLWGDNDPISPVSVGQQLLALLPDARLKIIKGGDHDLAQTHAEEVAGAIEQHLAHT
jgi:pimeloyl-ACP methyl ester carboxylesterase